jgi:hypothetical protein
MNTKVEPLDRTDSKTLFKFFSVKYVYIFELKEFL